MLETNTKMYIIASFIIFIIIVLSIVFYNVFKKEKTEVSNNDKGSNDKEVGKELGEDVQGSAKEDFNSCPGPIELPCREGPEGPRGPAGGIYTDKGPLRNLAQTDMVVDRMDGAGPYANAYLSQRNYKPQQTWILHSSDETDMANKISNQYGGCLNVDDIGNVNMTLPSGCKTATKWLFTSQGTLKPMDDKNKCLSYTDAGIVKNVQKTGMVNLNGKNINPYSNLLKLNVIPCDAKIPLNQQWAFD